MNFFYFINNNWRRFSHFVDRILGHYVTICPLLYLSHTLVLCTHLHKQNNVQLASDKCCWYNDSDTLNSHLRSVLYYNLVNIWKNNQINIWKFILYLWKDIARYVVLNSFFWFIIKIWNVFFKNVLFIKLQVSERVSCKSLCLSA